MTAALSPMVRLSRVSKRFGKTVALHDTTLDIDRGEFVSLLGPSGSGKSTLLNLIAGMSTPSTGTVHINGADVTNWPPEKRGLGMVFQNYALMPHLSVFENVAFPLRVRRLDLETINRRVAEVLNVVRLPDVAHRKPKELSGGQQQRISIARCLSYNPSLILMDEPLGALDKKLREQLQIEIKRLHVELGITIVYVTHDQEEALNMADRIVLMREGQVEQMGPPHELYSHPISDFAADFIGQSNMLPAHIVATGLHGVVHIAELGDIHVPVERGSEGDIGFLMIRPESIQVLESGVVVMDQNVLPCHFKTTIVAGGSMKHFVRLENGQEVVALELSGSRKYNRAPGTQIKVAWPYGAGRFVFPKSQQLEQII